MPNKVLTNIILLPRSAIRSKAFTSTLDNIKSSAIANIPLHCPTVSSCSKLIETFLRQQHIHAASRTTTGYRTPQQPKGCLSVMTESRFPHKFLRQMIFYRKHDQQKDYDKDNKPTASFHETPPFSISSCKARIVRKSSSVASKFP